MECPFCHSDRVTYINIEATILECSNCCRRFHPAKIKVENVKIETKDGQNENYLSAIRP